MKRPQFTDHLSLRAIYEYNLPHHVPLSGSTTFAELSAKSGLEESLLRRFLLHAMTNHIFTTVPSPEGAVKVRNDRVQHTALSRMLATNPDAFAAIGTVLMELAPASLHVLDAIRQQKQSSKDSSSSEPSTSPSTEPTHSGYQLANSTTLPMYAFLSQHPSRGMRIGAGMRFFTHGEGYDLRHLISGYDWASLDHPGAILVDVGGGQAAVSVALAARATTHMHFVVQDLPGTCAQGRALVEGDQGLARDVKDRVEFVPHDFFTAQPVRPSLKVAEATQGADVYFFRWIFHNWSDPHCVAILANLVPALRRGARVLIYEYVLGDGAEDRAVEKLGR